MTPLHTRYVQGRGLALAACATLLVPLAGCRQEEPPREQPPRAIAWERVSREAGGRLRVISGIVTAISDTRLAFEVGGTVETVDVDLGDLVEKDQVLARLDPEPFELTVRDGEAALAAATALREEARASYSRYETAVSVGAVSRQEFDRAVALRDARESQVDAARARLNLARRDLRRSTMRAPFRGSISSRNIDPAMEVISGQVAFEMDNEESGLRVEVQMPETLIARVRQGDHVEVGFPAVGDFDVGDERFAAVVSEVGTRAGAGNAFPVRADLVAPPPGLRPGMTAEVHFTLSRDTGDALGDFEGFVIPMAAALAEADDRFSVFVYDPQTSTLSKRPIRTGGVRDNSIAVLEGLAEGDVIATAGVAFLHDGQEVTLISEHLMRRPQ
jgi:RND family efflux transporter MFP subunit